MKVCSRCKLRYPDQAFLCQLDGAALFDLPDPLIGSTLAGRYVVQEVIGSGGMATVYRAEHRLIDRPCAIKVLNFEFSAVPSICERFRREAKLAQRLAHPNIIEIFDSGETDSGAPFLAMELLRGTTLADAITHRMLPLDQALIILTHMCRALARAHDFEVIHRDLKPENVFLLSDQSVKLLDFGIARCTQDVRLTSTGEVFGTPQYMAPERSLNQEAGPASDLYALGIMAFEMFAGRLPFEAHEPAVWLIKHLREVPPRLCEFVPQAPRALDNLIHTLLAKDPNARPRDAYRVLVALAEIAAELGILLPKELELPAHIKSAPVPDSNLGLWQQRLQLLERRIVVSLRPHSAFGNSVPSTQKEATQLLESLQHRLHETTAARSRAVTEQAALEKLEHDVRAIRARLGLAMDTLGEDWSRVHSILAQSEAKLGDLSAQSQLARDEIIHTQREILHWEGRLGFAVPHPEWAIGLRTQAEQVMSWTLVYNQLLSLENERAGQEQQLADLHFQIQALRTSLSQAERDFDQQKQLCLQRLYDWSTRAETLESSLISLTERVVRLLGTEREVSELMSELELPRRGYPAIVDQPSTFLAS